MVSAEDGLSTDPPLVIELFGHPGAGKSTLARAAVADSRRRTNAELGAAWKSQSKLAKGQLVGRTILDGACLGNAIKFAIGVRLFRGDSLPGLNSWSRVTGFDRNVSNSCWKRVICRSCGQSCIRPADAIRIRDCSRHSSVAFIEGRGADCLSGA